MKRFLFLTLTLLLMAGTAAFAQDKKQKKNADIQEVTFVTTIDCKNCVKKVEANLPYEKGIKDMKVNLDDRTVWIKYDAAKTDKEKLKKSHKGIVWVQRDSEGKLFQTDEHNEWLPDAQSELKTVFYNGVLYNKQTFAEIRERIAKGV